MIFSRWWPKSRQNTRLPDFLIIGAQKSGTSWLHACLRQINTCYLPEDKDFEVDFCNGDELPAFTQRFSDARPDQLKGDACAAWFWTQRGNDPITGKARNIVDDIHQVFGPRLKLILLLRNPVQRAISGYLHHIRFGSLSPDTPIMETDPALGIITLSQYGFHLNNWLKQYPADHFLVLPGPAETDAETILRQVTDFLRVPANSSNGLTKQVVMPGLKKFIDEEGVWVMLDADVRKKTGWTRAVPEKLVNNSTYIRLVSQKEIRALGQRLAADTHLFFQLTEKHGWQHAAFNQWLQHSQ